MSEGSEQDSQTHICDTARVPNRAVTGSNAAVIYLPMSTRRVWDSACPQSALKRRETRTTIFGRARGDP
jgi:hypothetical protein